MDGQAHLLSAADELEGIAKRAHGLVLMTSETVAQTIGGGGIAAATDRLPAAVPAPRGPIGVRVVNASSEIRGALDAMEHEIHRLRDSIGLDGPTPARGPEHRPEHIRAVR